MEHRPHVGNFGGYRFDGLAIHPADLALAEASGPDASQPSKRCWQGAVTTRADSSRQCVTVDQQ
jgi:hypothetical protein